MEKKDQLFFLIMPPGLSDALLIELSLLRPQIDFEIKEVDPKSGVLISTSLRNGTALNRLLKTPTRILLRLESFKVRDFPRLYQKLKKIVWRNFLNGEEPKISIAAHQSRLMHKERLLTCAQKAIKDYYKDFPPKKVDQTTLLPSTIFLRLQDDLCTVSIDTSGDRLNMRGERTFVGVAPIRENIAAALLLLLKKETTATTLLDPMCGSGTFLLESLDRFTLRDSTQFVYSQFPIIKKLKDEKEFTSPAGTLFPKHIGIEQDKKSFLAIKNNLKDRPAQIIHSSYKDVALKEESLAIIINPPYGKRIKIQGDLTTYYQTLLSLLMTKFSPQVIGIIIPREIKIEKILNRLGAHTLLSYPFQNGGIGVNFFIITLER